MTDAKINDLGIDKLSSGLGKYFTYLPNNSACADGEVLEWSATNTRWECGSAGGGGTGDLLNGGNAGAVSVGTTDANDLSLLTNGNTVLTVKDDGDIGIGTTTPATKIHLFGDNEDVTFESNATSPGCLLYTSDAADE